MLSLSSTLHCRFALNLCRSLGLCTIRCLHSPIKSIKYNLKATNYRLNNNTIIIAQLEGVQITVKTTNLSYFIYELLSIHINVIL